MAAHLAERGERQPHSLHANFLKPGNAARPLRFTVQTLSEGRSFAARRVEGVQGDAHVLTMTVSSQVPERGFQHAAQMPDVPDVASSRAAMDAWQKKQDDPARVPILGRLTERPVEILPVEIEAIFGDAPCAPRSASWMRLRDGQAIAPEMQRSALAYASDMLFLRNALLPHGVRPGERGIQITSLDHAIHFHRQPDFAQWHLYAGESPWAGAARGLSRGHFFAEDGTLIATVAQENLMRVIDGRRLDRATL